MDRFVLSGNPCASLFERFADGISFVSGTARLVILTIVFAISVFSQSHAQTIALSVDKPTYTTAGEVIKFTYSFNSGSSVVTSLTVKSSRFGDFAFCGAFSTTNTGATGTCTKNYTVQNSDIGSNKFILEAGSFEYDTIGVPGNSGGFSAPGQVRSEYVNPLQSQTINFTQPANMLVNDPTANLIASASSGLGVSFSSNNTAVCTVSGSTVSPVSAGTCSITANQPGNGSYLAAPAVINTFAITKNTQTIAFTNPGPQNFVSNGTVPLTATGGTSGNPVVFTSASPAICTVLASMVTMVSAGTCSINANQAGNANFDPAPQVNQSFVINQAVQVITFVQPASVSFLPGVTVALNATSSSGLLVALASNSPAICTVNGFTATILTVGTCSITASQAGNASFLAAASVTRIFSANGDLIVERTQRVISNFLVRRGSRILASDPDLSERLTSNPVGGAAQSNVLGFSATGTSYNRSFAVDTSLRKIANAGSAANNKQGEIANISSSEYGANRLDQSYDIWMQGKWDHSESGTSESDLGLLYIGVDYQFSSRFVAGLMVQFDWADEVDITNNTVAEGQGWMVGPYIVARLHENLIFDGRIAGGRSDNKVSPMRTYTDEFTTQRWLLKAKLTGDFEKNNWRFMPHVGVSYLEEEQQAYTDNFGLTIPQQTVSIGQLTFGPKISTIITNDDGSTFEPHFGIKGIWDFDTTELVNLTTGLVQTTDDLRGRAEGGATWRNPNNGWSLTADIYYDGIGASNFSAYGGGLKLTIPLN